MTPWPQQTKGHDLMRASVRGGHTSPLLVMPTGAGKTPTMCMVIASAVAKGSRVIVLTHRIELLKHVSAKLDEFGLAHGLISPHYKQTTDVVQVASVQTLVRRLHKLPWVPTIFCVDEAHLSCAPTYGRIFAAFPKAYKLGMTATPWRLDSKGLGTHCGGHFDDIVEPTSMQELIDGGYLVKPIVYAPSTPDMKGVRTVMGDYDHAQLEKVMDKPSLVGDAVAHWKRLANGRPTIAFCVSIAHAEHVAAQFCAAGVRAKAVSGNTPIEERFDAIRALGDGRLDLVANCCLFVDSLDQPKVSCIILLSPTQSLTRYLQCVGRGMRRSPGKQNLIVLDHAACCFTFGLPQEKRTWSLDGAKPKSKADAEAAVQRMKLCQNCFGMNPQWRQSCEQCNAPFDATRAPPKQTDGELVEVTDADRERLRVQARREVAAARTPEALMEIARRKGHHPGWVHHVMRARSQRRAG